MSFGLYAPGSFTGEYTPRGDMSQISPDTHLVVTHAFGYRQDGPGLSNQAIAGFAEENFADYRLVAHHTLAPALQAEPDLLIGGEASGKWGGGVGTDGELDAAVEFADQHQLIGFVLLGQAFHLPRITRQARLRRMDIVVPPDQPAAWDPESCQPWTWNAAEWRAREWKAQPYVLARDALRQATKFRPR